MQLADLTAVVLHPHPSMGGDSSHPFVVAVADRLAARGATVATPDVHNPDVLAAATALDANILVGYSWGSIVVSHASPTGLAARVLVAPPISMTLGAVDAAPVPTLVLVPEHDQYGDLDTTRAQFAEHPRAAVELVAGADHFLWGHVDAIADRVVNWLSAT
jgi:alpha/beta superfamily hydrolase